jgi:hypothetical protein
MWRPGKSSIPLVAETNQQLGRAPPDRQTGSKNAPPAHLQAYLDEVAFRHNGRKTDGIARIAGRVIEQLVVRAPLTMRSLVRDTVRSRWFASNPEAENLS